MTEISMGTLLCDVDEVNLDNVKCCKKCPPEWGVVSPCSHKNNTECWHCTQGLTFSAHSSHEEPCIRCAGCPANSFTKFLCNTTHDTVCECDPHYYWEDKERTCVPCDTCNPGYGASKMCTSYMNTRCQPCPDGTFSDRKSGEGCRVCTVCDDHQIMFQRCNPQQNTICVELPLFSSRAPEKVSTNSADKNQQTSNHSNYIPIYCAILGAVIIGLLIYVIVKHIKRKEANKKNKATPAETKALKPGSDSGVYVENDHRQVTGVMLYRDVPEFKRKILENMMHATADGKKGWFYLASELGFSNLEIEDFSVAAAQEGHSPVFYFLSHWSRKGNATVDVLLLALRNIGRDDVIYMLLTDPKGMIGQAPQMV